MAKMARNDEKLLKQVEKYIKLKEKREWYETIKAYNRFLRVDNKIETAVGKIDTLINGGADVNTKFGDGDSILHRLVKMNDHVTLEKFMGVANFNVNVEDAEGLTPLVHAAINGNDGIIQMLKEKGATTPDDIFRLVKNGRCDRYTALRTVMFMRDHAFNDVSDSYKKRTSDIAMATMCLFLAGVSIGLAIGNAPLVYAGVGALGIGTSGLVVDAIQEHLSRKHFKKLYRKYGGPKLEEKIEEMENLYENAGLTSLKLGVSPEDIVNEYSNDGFTSCFEGLDKQVQEFMSQMIDTLNENSSDEEILAVEQKCNEIAKNFKTAVDNKFKLIEKEKQEREKEIQEIEKEMQQQKLRQAKKKEYISQLKQTFVPQKTEQNEDEVDDEDQH